MAAWLRILFAEGPRQVINALTLYSVMQLNLLPTGDNAAKDGHTPVVQFFVNVGLLADNKGKEQAAILFGMLYTLVFWVITLINLMVAVTLYLLFLFHHIPSSDGGLTGYCRRKINKSMEKIVRTKVEKALRKENALLAREGEDAMKRQPTLPNLDLTNDEKPPMLSRATTQATLPEYTSQPGTSRSSALTSPSDLERQPTLPDIESADFHPGPPTRVDTHASSASWASHGSNVPLMGGAGGMGYGQPGRMPSPGGMSPADSYGSRSVPDRSYSGYSQSTQRSYTPGIGQQPSISQSGRSRPGMYQMEPIPRVGTAMSGRRTPAANPSPVDSYGRWTPAEQDNPYFPPGSDHSPPGSAATLPRSITPGVAPMRSHTPGAPSRSITPATPSYGRSYNPEQPPMPRLHTNASSIGGGYQSYSANSNSPAQSSFTPQTPYRSFTQSNISTASPDQYRQHTPQSPASGYAAQQIPGHAFPTQRHGTAPPTTRQNTPVADHVMEDIMNGY
jgi:hypothetical protein